MSRRTRIADKRISLRANNYLLRPLGGGAFAPDRRARASISWTRGGRYSREIRRRKVHIVIRPRLAGRAGRKHLVGMRYRGQLPSVQGAKTALGADVTRFDSFFDVRREGFCETTNVDHTGQNAINYVTRSVGSHASHSLREIQVSVGTLRSSYRWRLKSKRLRRTENVHGRPIPLIPYPRPPSPCYADGLYTERNNQKRVCGISLENRRFR